jgi:hypothetical protein
VSSDSEHQHRKANREERWQRRGRWVQNAEPGPADESSRRELTNQDWQQRSSARRKCRSQEGGRHQDRQLAEHSYLGGCKRISFKGSVAALQSTRSNSIWPWDSVVNRQPRGLSPGFAGRGREARHRFLAYAVDDRPQAAMLPMSV